MTVAAAHHATTAMIFLAAMAFPCVHEVVVFAGARYRGVRQA